MVVSYPAGYLVLSFFDRVKQLSCLPVMTNNQIKALQLSILAKLNWLDIIGPNPTFTCLNMHNTGDIFCSVITPNSPRLSVPADDRFKRLNQSLGGQ